LQGAGVSATITAVMASSRRHLVWWCGVVFASVILLSISPRGAAARRVSGNLVFWDQSRGFDAIVANVDVFSEISPFWYHLDVDGRVIPYLTASGTSYEDPSILSFLRSNGILVIPTVANIVDGVWNGALAGSVIADPVLSAANINSLVDLAVGHGYDGIDLDYEGLRATDRAAFTAFVERLAVALHTQGKLLTVNVYAKTAEPGSWDGPQAQDWSALGSSADQVRIMTYEYSWSTSAAGPISPVNWVTDVIAFARTVIPAAKIMQGVPFYGYDWVGQRGTELVWNDATALASRYGASINWDSASASPWFQYLVNSVLHTVWFENASSVAAKLAVTTTYDVGGVTLWRLGGEDPGIWPALRQQFGTPSSADVTPPVVTISSPGDGSAVTKKMTIAAQASDDVRVAKVVFSVNGVVLATDTQAPYAVTWNTRNAIRGANVLAATAYDSSGNTATAQVTVYKSR
jgi:spore germination protein YaaH